MECWASCAALEEGKELFYFEEGAGPWGLINLWVRRGL